jgi:hypothetical protein
MFDDEEITEELEESLDLILAEITGMEEVMAEASDLEIAASDRVLITGEIDALWDQGDALMSWLISTTLMRNPCARRPCFRVGNTASRSQVPVTGAFLTSASG